MGWYYRKKRQSLADRMLRQLLIGSFMLIWRILREILRLALPAEKPCEAPSELAIREFYRSPEWHMLARRIKDKRGRKCECCGDQYPKVKICTDHIKSLRTHWHLRLEASNMQVLCDVCNRHKGSHITADFRKLSAPWYLRLVQ